MIFREGISGSTGGHPHINQALSPYLDARPLRRHEWAVMRGKKCGNKARTQRRSGKSTSNFTYWIVSLASQHSSRCRYRLLERYLIYSTKTERPPGPGHMITANLIRTFAHLYPLYSGYGQIANLKPFVRVSAHVPSPCWTRLRAGPEILVPLDDWVGRALFYIGDLDPKLSWLCRRLLRQGDTMLDIGANIGVMSLIARELVGPAGAVHAIEPQPRLVEMLRESANRNKFENLYVHQCALGREDQTLDLAVPHYNGGAASLIRSLSEYKRVTRVPVAVKHTSTYLDSLNLDRIRLMKIDVEGFEAQVIEGGMRYFEAHRPDSIVFELNDHSVTFFEQPVVRLLQTIDYEFLNIPKVRLRMRLEPLVREDQAYGHDILAIARGPTHADTLRCLAPAVGIVPH